MNLIFSIFFWINSNSILFFYSSNLSTFVENSSAWQYWFFNHQLFCKLHEHQIFYFLVQFFFFLLLVSLLLGFFIIGVRFNVLNDFRWTKISQKFPFQVVVAIFNILFFFVSCAVLYFNFSIPTFFSSLALINLQESFLFLQLEGGYWRPVWQDHLLLCFWLKYRATEILGCSRCIGLQQYYNFIFLPFVIKKSYLVSGIPELINVPFFGLFVWSNLSTAITPLILSFSETKNVYFVLLFSQLKYIFRAAHLVIFSFDSLSLIFICLTIFIITLCVFVSWFSYKRETLYLLIPLLLITQFFVIFVFSTLDLIFFYLAFESVLIPLFFLVGIFGSRERRVKAAYYLMFYTLVGSLPLLAGILYIWLKTGQTNVLILEPYLFGLFTQSEMKLLWILFLPGFAFKIPLYPFHLWLPEAHVEAPTVGSVILAGLVLKLGGYGFMRFSIGLFYWGGVSYLYFLYWGCLFSMIIAVFCAACQIDIKRIIAYGSVSHMGLVTLCIFLATQTGFESAMIMMLGHGFVSSALFILVGSLYERFHSRNIRYYGGLYRVLPRFGTLFFLFVLYDIGVPSSPSFVAEMFAFIAVVSESILLAIFLTFPVVFGVGVGLIICSRLLFGLNEQRNFLVLHSVLLNFVYWATLQKKQSLQIGFTRQKGKSKEYFYSGVLDLLYNEVVVLITLFFAAFFLGIYPSFYMIFFNETLENILKITTY